MRNHRPNGLLVVGVISAGLVWSALVASGCSGNPIGNGLPQNGVGCSTCHGSVDNPAPPLALNGSSLVSDIGVGAHQKHLHDGAIRQAIACSECHVVPKAVNDPGHILGVDINASVTFGTLASTGGVLPAWNRDAARCTNAYCHGATLQGGTQLSPKWTQVDGSQATCDSCHGNPPPPPHPASSQCATCHPQTVDAQGGILVAGGKHIDGTVESLGTACDSCHGSNGNPAPPVDTHGNSDTTAIGVGSHRPHLQTSDWHKTLACSECHVVPATVDAPGHIDNPPRVDLIWGPLATADGASPSFDTGSATCSSVYCHGAKIYEGATGATPTWTRVGAGEAACGTCHALPPANADHPQRSDCASCHGCVADASQKIILQNAQLHINGRVNLEHPGSCPSQ